MRDDLEVARKEEGGRCTWRRDEIKIAKHCKRQERMHLGDR